MRRPAGSRVVRAVAVAAISLTLATLVVWLLERAGVDNAGVVYVVAVAVTAVLGGTPGAIGASIGAFLLYDYFFVEPRYTFTIRDPEEWLNVLLLVFVAVLVGQLTATLRRQTDTAREREREARAMFRVSRALATRTSTVEAARSVVEGVVAETVATRAWIEIVVPEGLDRVVVDTDPGTPRPSPTSVFVLRRTDGDAPAEWTQLRVPTRPTSRSTGATESANALHKVLMEAGGRRVGALWALIPKSEGRPDRTDTRLLAAVADQVAQAIEADRLATAARDAAIALESDRVKTALLESVSHDLRTPLAAIRAAAGTLMDRSVEIGPEDRYLTAETIDQDADRLNRIVTNLLDLSRVEGGALKPELDGYDVGDLVEAAVDRFRPRLGSRPVTLDLGSPPPVRVDPTFLEQILENLLANVLRYTAPEVPVRVSASWAPGDPTVRLTVEDGGAGVPDDALPRLFDKFYRVPGRPQAKGGSGVGLAVVRGFAEAMGGTASARRSRLGGLAVDVTLPVAGPVPVESGTG
jgi:two-component system sensor histidine kinase KdpD